MTIPSDQFEIPTPSPSPGQVVSQQARQGWGARTNHIPFDPEYTLGARNAVNVCLRVRPEEKVCVITDEVTLEIAAAIVSELEKLGASYNAWVLEDFASRPLTDLPQRGLD